MAEGESPQEGQGGKESPQEALQALRQKLADAYPEANSPMEAENLDELFLCQLWENLWYNGPNPQVWPEALLEERPEGLSYWLPFDFRQVNGKYHLFIPRVASWYYIRHSPRRGQHPPFTETYRQGHRFSQSLERIMNMDKDVFCDTDEPIQIGALPSIPQPYHHLYWTKEGLVLELSTKPTLPQIAKIDQLKKGLSAYFPVKTLVVQEGQPKNLGTFEEEMAEASAHIRAVSAEFPSARVTKPHDIKINEDQSVEVLTYPRIERRSIILSFGYIPSQIKDVESDIDSEMQDVYFFFDPYAMNHANAKASYVIESIARKKEARLIIQEGAPLDSGDIRKSMETEFEDYKTVKLDEKWDGRPEVVDDLTPFFLRIDGLELPCGLRAQINLPSREILVEIFTDSDTFENTYKKEVLQKAALTIARKLKRRYIPYWITGEPVQFEAEGKVLPVYKGGETL